MRLVWVGLSAAVWASPCLASAQMNITDDPYKAYVQAEFRGPLRSQNGQSYCGDGASYAVYGLIPRASGKLSVGMSIEADGLRSPGEITAVDLLGGLALTKTGERLADPYCYGAAGCHNDALAQFVVPDETLSAIKAQGRVPLRVTTTMGDKCLLTGAITADEIAQLEAWAASQPPKAAK
jgi:hypothetical protein